MKQSQIANEWRAEGRTEGRAEGKQESLLDVLECRFHATTPEIVATVTTTQDVNRLTRWIKLAAEANSLADFEAGMGE